MTLRFNAATRGYRAASARLVRFIVGYSIAGVVVVAVALWLGARR